ncbi:Uncharacterized protein Fot_56618 [Forsythia ovata]|uniref:Uncharacterized protein n=1 Tax=Forsythia ovata TaxID=205694 RepID=A0ABD1NZ49_9LAMI
MVTKDCPKNFTLAKATELKSMGVESHTQQKSLNVFKKASSLKLDPLNCKCQFYGDVVISVQIGVNGSGAGGTTGGDDSGGFFHSLLPYALYKLRYYRLNTFLTL